MSASPTSEGPVTDSEIREALKMLLEDRGELGRVRALLRSLIFHALEEGSSPKPALPAENVIINELILDYLNANEYLNTASVLIAESGQPNADRRIARSSLASDLGFAPSEANSPLLYAILLMLRRRVSYAGSAAETSIALADASMGGM